MDRKQAKALFRDDTDAYGKPKAVMTKLNKIFDEFEEEKRQSLIDFLTWVHEVESFGSDDIPNHVDCFLGTAKTGKLTHSSKTTKIQIPSKGTWVLENSSGYLGSRCTVCATWIYQGLPRKCQCDEKV